MRLQIQFEEFLKALNPHVNAPLELDTILKPFGISACSGVSDSLLIGHLIDYMTEEWGPKSLIDPIDVCIAAGELGHEGATQFIEEAPQIMTEMAKNIVQDFL